MNALFVIGTRPEAIKLSPLILAYHQHYNSWPKLLCTGQHHAIVKAVLEEFDIPVSMSHPEIETPDLTDRYAQALTLCRCVIQDTKPDIVIVQGDTLSAFCGAMAAFLNHTKIAHVEAGLRTENIRLPFPEEANRRLISQLADLHFAPTQAAVNNLHETGIQNGIHLVGNTGIDAIMHCAKKLNSNQWDTTDFQTQYNYSNAANNILITLHRRENWHPATLTSIVGAIQQLGTQHSIQCLLCAHPNPTLQNALKTLLKDLEHVTLLPPLPYSNFVYHMMHCDAILTDSGGIQEEAPSIGKHVVVMRNETERLEGLKMGLSRLVGTDTDRIVDGVSSALSKSPLGAKENPYGDGKSAMRILTHIQDLLQA